MLRTSLAIALSMFDLLALRSIELNHSQRWKILDRYFFNLPSDIESEDFKTFYGDRRWADVFRFVCKNICIVLGRPEMDLEIIISYMPIYLMKKFPSDRSHDSFVYLLQRAKDIHELTIKIKFEFYWHRAASMSKTPVNYGNLSHLYSLLRLYSLEIRRVPGVVLAETRVFLAQGGGAERAEEAFSKCLDAMDELSNHPDQIRCSTVEIAEEFVRNFTRKVRDAMSASCVLLGRLCYSDVLLHRLALCLLRHSNVTSGRFYTASSDEGIYEDHTTANFCNQFLNLALMLRHGVMDVYGIMTVDAAILFQLCDSAEIHFDCVSKLRACESSTKDKVVKYRNLHEQAFVPTENRFFDDRVLLDLIAPDLYTALHAPAPVAIPAEAQPVATVQLQPFTFFNVDGFFVRS
jgi:hypothetical protein